MLRAVAVSGMGSSQDEVYVSVAGRVKSLQCWCAVRCGCRVIQLSNLACVTLCDREFVSEIGIVACERSGVPTALKYAVHLLMSGRSTFLLFNTFHLHRIRPIPSLACCFPIKHSGRQRCVILVAVWL